jgi:parvulin-like peptidyl-prolyl isomerase
MSLEFDEGHETRDRTRYVWIGVALMLAAMVGALLLVMRPAQDKSITRARVKHILIEFDRNNPADYTRALKEASEVRKKLLDGGDFTALAKEYSDDELTARKGGDMGWVKYGELVNMIDEFIWQHPTNELSEIIRSPYGLHLVVVTERQLSEADRYEQELKRKVFGDAPPEDATAPPAAVSASPDAGQPE